MQKPSLFVISWVLVSILSWVLGALISTFITSILSSPDSSLGLIDAAQMVLYMILVGFFSSFGNRFLLNFFQVDAKRWFRKTIIGWAAGIVLAFVVGALLIIFLYSILTRIPFGSSEEASWFFLSIGALVIVPIMSGLAWIILGTTVGVFQSGEIRNWGGKGKQWIILSGLSWLFGGVLCITLYYVLPYIYATHLISNIAFDVPNGPHARPDLRTGFSVVRLMTAITMGTVIGFTTGKRIKPLVLKFFQDPSVRQQAA